LLVLTSALPGDWLSLCEGKARVRVLPRRGRLSEEKLAAAAKRASALVTLLSDPVTERVLAAGPGLKVVANYAVGTDNIDLSAARRLGVVVTNTPGVLTEATADLAWALLLGVARRVAEGHRMMLRGAFKGWEPGLLLGLDLQGKTLGVVGMGRIGRAVARRASAFGMRVLYAQRRRLLPSEEAALGAAFAPLEELLGRCDVVTLHCPLTPETRHLLDSKRLGSMKPGAILINTGRGPLVDETALVEALRSGHLSGAGLDVYEREPELAPGLKECPNVLLLPHAGSAGMETRAAMARMAVGDALAVLEGRQPRNEVKSEQ
jgi:glyoxylate reductase